MYYIDLFILLRLWLTSNNVLLCWWTITTIIDRFLTVVIIISCNIYNSSKVEIYILKYFERNLVILVINSYIHTLISHGKRGCPRKRRNISSDTPSTLNKERVRTKLDRLLLFDKYREKKSNPDPIQIHTTETDANVTKEESQVSIEEELCEDDTATDAIF